MKMFRFTARRSIRLAVLLGLLALFFNQAVLYSQDSSTSQTGGGLTGPVLVIPVEGDIDSGVSFFIQRMIRKAERERVSAIVLVINSNGGLVKEAQNVKDALLRSSILTVAFIKGRALSAAALIAISCQKILMTQGAEMGAATPFMLLGSSVKAAEPKFVSAFRAEFEGAAEARRRPKALAGAMVDKDHDTIPGLVKRGEILTLTTETAKEFGYCDYIVSDVDQVLKRLNLAATTIERVEPTSGEELARWLTSPNISVLLFTIGIWTIILELLIFGWGILGWVGLMFLGLFFGGHLFAYLAGMEALILFMVGLLLLLLELLVIPGFGITGILGILSLTISIIIVFGGVYLAVHAIAKIMALSIMFLIFTYYMAPKIRLFDRFVLKQELNSASGFVAVDSNPYETLVHLEGITLSPCRPSGFARIGTERLEVVSEGDFIERDVRVVVVRVEGTKIVIRALEG